MNEENKREKKSVVKTVFESLVTAIGCLFITFICMIPFFRLPKWFGDDDLVYDELLGGKFNSVVAILILISVLHGVLKYITLTCEDAEKSFNYDPPSVIKEKLSFLFRRAELYITFGSFALLILVLPLRWTCVALDDLFVGEDAGFAVALTVKILFLLAVFVIDVSANLSAYNVWWRDRVEHPNKKRSDSEMTVSLMVSVLPWMFGGAIISWMLSGVLPLANLVSGIFTPTTLIIVGVVIAAYYVFRVARAFIKRGRFYSELSSLCKNYGFSVSPINKPLLSVQTMPEGESFNITANDKKYSCKLIGAPSKNDPLAIYDNGTCTFIHAVHFLKATLMHYVRSYVYAYEADPDATKVIIVNPVAKELLTGQDGHNVPIDNGDDVGGYKVYAGTAFINALRRDIVEKKVN